jgi:hypothetical protein
MQNLVRMGLLSLWLVGCGGDEPDSLSGLNALRYQQPIQSDYLYNGAEGFEEAADVWLAAGYRQGSCDVTQTARTGCVYEYVIVEVGPQGKAAGRAPGDVWGELVWNETPKLIDGFAPDERVQFDIVVTADSSYSAEVGSEWSWVNALVDDEDGAPTLVAEWDITGNLAGATATPEFREWGGNALRNRLCNHADATMPGGKCPPTCTQGGAHPEFPTCAEYAAANPRE